MNKKIVITALLIIALIVLPNISSANSQEDKVKSYLSWKEELLDKDFVLRKSLVVRHTAGERIEFFNYNINYGFTLDNNKEYMLCKSYLNKDGSWLVKPAGITVNPEKYLPVDPNDFSAPVKIIFDSLSQKELDSIMMIFEFSDGDLDIRFYADVEKSRQLTNNILLKIQAQDEAIDLLRTPVTMQPIVPEKRQWLPLQSKFVDEDQNGEDDYVYVPCSIDGSLYDKDPSNDRVHVMLKYKLITRADIEAAEGAEKQRLIENYGYWQYKTPVEIWIDFTDENPGPDVRFFDGPAPDGTFDRYEFLY